ncbi:MAG: polysaccharide pyruvyl transferase family protein [Bdellovibrionales bacterium]|nr:polysaccharide pyruvyl transferase family protein [Bdellovibrionales bacterium]
MTRNLKKIIKFLVRIVDRLLAFVWAFLAPRSARTRTLIIPPTGSTGGLGDQSLLEGCIHLLDGQCDVLFVGYVSIVDEKLLPTCKTLRLNSKFFPFLEFVRIASRYKQLAVVGADVMFGQYSPENVLKMLQLLRFAERLGLDTRIVSFSWLTCENTAIIQAFKKLKCTHFFLRDSMSREAFQSTFSAKRTHLVSDVAFCMPERKSEAIDGKFSVWLGAAKADGHIILGINLNGALERCFEQQQIEALLNSVIDVLGSENISVVFIPHDYRKGISDQDLSQRVANNMAQTVNRYLFERRLSAYDVRNVLRQVDIAISTRFHFTVSCLCSATPSLFIGQSKDSRYDAKVQGLVRDCNLKLKSWSMDEAVAAPSAIAEEVFRLKNFQAQMASEISSALADTVARAKQNFSPSGRKISD